MIDFDAIAAWPLKKKILAPIALVFLGLAAYTGYQYFESRPVAVQLRYEGFERPLTVTLRDQAGAMWRKTRFEKESSHTVNLAPGSYWVELVTPNERLTRQFDVVGEMNATISK